MIYWIIKPLIRIALYFFFRKINVNYSDVYAIKGPVLITANHPNSFLDAILIGAFFKKPIHFFARGDAFKKPIHRFLLGLLNMIPIYRLSEGKENLYLNEYSFKATQNVLQNEGIVLIFIEGVSLLTHQLQPFKKGAARIVMDYEGDKPLYVLPLGLAYNRFNSWGGTATIHAGRPIPAQALLPFGERAKNICYFNDKIKQELNQLIKLPKNGKPNHNVLIKILGYLGYIIHWWIFHCLDTMIRRKTKNTVFHDSVLFGSLFILYPLLLVIFGFCLISFLGMKAILLLLAMLIMARCIVLVKNPRE